MCGIVGYVGEQQAVPILLGGLKKLEYRGYDSAGIAIYNGQRLAIKREVGNLDVLWETVAEDSPQGTWGLGHTRWATHGRPTHENAHPHSDCSGNFVVVHNGIIENFQELRTQLEKKGHLFCSETDTEIIAHLIEELYQGDLLQAVSQAVKELQGSYAMAVMSTQDPYNIVAVRQDSPLIVGVGEKENFLASDIPALLDHTRRIVIMENGEMVQLTPQEIEFFSLGGTTINKEVEEIDWDPEMVEKGGFPHFMLKEINEEPATLRHVMAGRLEKDGIKLEEFQLDQEQLAKIDKIFIVACGTAYHSGLVGKKALEEMTQIPVEVDLASEFRYRQPLVDEKTLVVVVSQSGETADTLAALRHAREKGARVLGIVNVVGSSIARESQDVIYLKAGPEIAVASTKAYLAMLAAFYLLAGYLGQLMDKANQEEIIRMLEGLRELPLKAEQALQDTEEDVLKAAEYIAGQESTFFIGRGLDYSLSLEGALKLKEISYIHAEAQAAGELKHGTLALITDGVPVVALVNEEGLTEKMISNIQEVKARGGYIIGVTRAGLKQQVGREVHELIVLPDTMNMLTPLLTILPLQLLAYHAARLRGCEIDQPRNLAKSVTVE